jgi:hypothetical protein
MEITGLSGYLIFEPEIIGKSIKIQNIAQK